MTARRPGRFCYVDDLIEGMLRMKTPRSFTGPVNLGNPSEFTMLELAELVIEPTGSKSKLCSCPFRVTTPTETAGHLAGQSGARLEPHHGTRAGSRAHNSIF